MRFGNKKTQRAIAIAICIIMVAAIVLPSVLAMF